MQRDFHYFGTYLAARGAGFSHEHALKLGEYAELVDETWNSRKGSKIGGHKNYVGDHDNEFNWEPEHFFGVTHRRGSLSSSLPKVQRTVTAVLSAKMMQEGGGRKPWFILSWCAFHFLPNLDPIGPPVQSNVKPNYRQRYAFIYSDTRSKTNTDILAKEQMLICYPMSTLANAMVVDTTNAIAAVGRTGMGDIPQYIKDTIPFGDKLLEKFEKYNGGFSPKEFILALVGVRLHVFADLWAHQGHTGARSPRINDACRFSFHVRHGKELWFREVDSKSHKLDYDFKDKWLPASHYGHGCAYSYPDFPSYRYRYVRPFDYRVIDRDNPKEYEEAYHEMYKLLKYLHKKVFSESGNPDGQFHPSIYNADFWQNRFIVKMEDAHQKPPRNKRLRELASNGLTDEQKEDFIKDDANADFGLIESMHERYSKNKESNLAYFSLAARCHLEWFNIQMLNSPFRGNFPNWANQNLVYEPDVIENFIKR